MKIKYQAGVSGTVEVDAEDFDGCESAAEVRSMIIEICEVHMVEQNMPGLTFDGLDSLADKLWTGDHS